MIAALCAVMNAKIGHAKLKPTLAALADTAQPDSQGDWIAACTIGWLAAITERGESTVRADLVELEALGWIQRFVEVSRHRRDACWAYRLDRDRINEAVNPALKHRAARTNPRSVPNQAPPGTSAGQEQRPPPEFSTTSAKIRHDQRQDLAPHIDEQRREQRPDLRRADAREDAHGVRAPGLEAAEPPNGSASELSPVPEDLIRALRADPQLGPHFGAGWLSACGYDPARKLIVPSHPRQRGLLEDSFARRVLRPLGVGVAEPQALASIQRALARSAG